MSSNMTEQIQAVWRGWLDAEGFEERPAQRQMIERLSEGLQTERPVMAIEAPTGTGKTIAYLAATLPTALAADRKLIIATSTVTLQKQIMQRELPSLAKTLDFGYVLAKGRQRYLCRMRLERALDGDAQNTLDVDTEEAPDAEGLKLYQRMRAAAHSERWSGDIDEWSQKVDPRVWRRVTASGAQCIGKKCRWYEKGCAFYESKRRMWQPDVSVVVANHDLVLSDLQLNGGAVLPPPDKAIYIFDEAHKLGDKTCAHAAVDGRPLGDGEWLDREGKVLRKLLAEDAKAGGELNTLLEDLGVAVDRVGDDLNALAATEFADCDVHDDLVRFRHGRPPTALRESASDLGMLYGRLREFLQQLRDKKESDSEYGDEAAGAYCAQMGARCDFAAKREALWRACGAADAEETAPRARWLKIVDGGYHVHAQPVQAGPFLNELWTRAQGVVLCSATLRMAGDEFARFKQQIAFPDWGVCHAIEHTLNHSAAELHIPDLGCDPKRVDEHTQAVTDYLLEALPASDGGSLTLFASMKQMQEVRRRLGAALSMQMLWQDERSIEALLKDHKREIDAGRHSAVFGLASFAEGLDLPGDYCRQVIICKLFFAPPSDPVVATLNEWWEEKNGGNAFQDIAVPETALRLVQACGRLLRTDSDSGRIVLLDSRVRSQRYGKRMLKDLPPYRVVLE